ncbi:hypothetical protein [Amycolatopsis sp. lyj-90]
MGLSPELMIRPFWQGKVGRVENGVDRDDSELTQRRTHPCCGRT